MFGNEFLNDKDFLKMLENHPIKEQHIKIEVLDFKERPISEIQGKCTSGSISIDGASSMRRTCNFTMIVDNETFDLTNVESLISINKKIRVHVGYTNFIRNYQFYGNTIWFPLGIYVVQAPTISHGVSDSTISITAKDKMCLLNGECAGTLPAPVSLHDRLIRESEDVTKVEMVPIYDIIREAVIHLGGEDPSKVIINDVPLEIKKVFRYVGAEPIYFDGSGNQVTSGDPSAVRVINSQDLAGYDWVKFTYPGELIKQAGDSVASILDSIKGVLGNYEYFYDVDGNFIFQEMKNYLNTSYTPITELNTGDYAINFGESYHAYSFKDSNIITSYNNTPNYQNIKNDFIVWGKRISPSGAQIPIRYHVAIDDIPQNTEGKPWQVFLYEYGERAETNGTDPGYYYRELKGEIPKLYDFDKNDWKIKDSSSMDFFLDFIDSNSELGKFSVNTIGRRTKVVVDDQVTTLYRPDTPDYIILEKSSPGLADKIAHFNKIGQKYFITDEMKKYTYATSGKDAFGIIRDLIFQHTTYSESITISALPLYNLEPNVRIEVEDKKSNIYGDYIIKSISLPLTNDGTMSVSATRATNRL